MLYAIGTKVRFIHTGDTGTVKGRLDGGMLSVYLPDIDMEIPAAEEDLVRAEDLGKAPVKAKIVQGKKRETPAPKPPPAVIETQYAIIKSYGLQVAFLPVENREGLTENYRIFLLNDTTYDVLYDVHLLLNYRTLKWDGKLPSASYVEVGEMLYDDLNEAPEIDAEVRWVSTEGIGEPVDKLLKIKAKTFFKSLKTVPFLNQPAHLFRLFDRPSQAEEKPEEDLAAYTKRNVKPNWMKQADQRVLTEFSAQELADFELEKDLHIEQLTDNPLRIPKADILRIQLSEFDKYLDKAIRLGVPHVFIIHGIGEGKLRDAIATRLFKHPEVETFKNEFHPKYGWGATEVIF